MKMTQQDYDERKARAQDGTADDEDNRLVKLYEREGFTPTPRGDEPVDEFEDDEEAPYTEWSFEDLKNEAGRRKLLKSGGREDLIKRLEEDDEKAQA